MNDYGKLFWKDGSKYEGNFARSVLHGFGTKYAADESIVYRGQWKDGTPHKGNFYESRLCRSPEIY